MTAIGLVHGAVALAEWLGKDKHPVSRELAELRAEHCMRCPVMRSAKGWKDRVTAEAAKWTKTVFRLKGYMELTTSKDAKLGVCGACDCPLKLKVWAPVDHIREYTDEETLAKLHRNCWILNEP